MKINWQIEKKRGNYRPKLSYQIMLEEFERELAVDAVQIKSSIAKLQDATKEYCMPGSHERHPDWQPQDYHYLSVPYFKDGKSSGVFRLPFRENGEYPEVEASFQLLRKEYEEVVKKAYAHQPIKTHGELDLTRKTKEAIAASLTAKKMLAFCGG